MIDNLFINIQLLSYLACCGAFLMLAVLVGLSRTGGSYKYLLLTCSIVTVLWSGTVVAVQWAGAFPRVLAGTEILRDVLWLALLGAMLGIRRFCDGGVVGRLAILTVISVSVFLFVAEAVMGAAFTADYPLLVISGHVLLSVIGLLALENLYRNSSTKFRWAIKYLCFGAGTILAYDFVLYADAGLFGQIDQNFFDARGFANAIAVPLLAVSVSRATLWDIDIHMSRSAVFHSTALMGSGVYLLGMAGIGYYLREMGGDWGRILQVLFLASAVLILFVLFSSTAARAKFRVWISKHFFSYKYDYREEWLRFIQTIASTDGPAGLHERIVRSVADIVDCNAGGLWVLHPGDNAYISTAQTQFGDRLPAMAADSPMIGFLGETHWIVDLAEYRRDPSRYHDTVFPGWLTENNAMWLVVPLINRDTMQAFLVLGDPRVRRGLDWEDYDLLRTVGNQAASYLAEEEAMHELSDARRLEDFNRRSAFIIHDIKNVVSQMSLMTQNAEKFGDNPEFQKDMIATVGNSVARMKDLLQRFKTVQNPEPDVAADAVLLSVVMGDAAAAWLQQKPDMDVDFQETADPPVDRKRLDSVLNHLLQNAIEASGPKGRVALRQKSREGEIVIEIEDNGPGMDADYIENRLFRPLDSEKKSGYGLGAFQTRQLVREMGGRLEVFSEVGKGTVMTIVLPTAAASQPTVPAMKGLRTA